MALTRSVAHVACAAVATAVIVAAVDLESAGAASVSTATAVKAAKWGTNVKITVHAGTFTFVSNGLPNHSRPSQYAVPNMGVVVPGPSSAHVAKDPTRQTHYNLTIATAPTYLPTTSPTPMGTIGVMISGAVLFNPYEGDGTTVALASNFSIKDPKGVSVFFVDSCNGHPTPMGQYHYHGLPTCVTAKVDKPKGPSHLIGVALDGFPIYGNRDLNGSVVAPAKLDSCNGIVSATPEFPKGIYHYVLENVPTKQSAPRCFHGKVSSSLAHLARSYGACGSGVSAPNAAVTKPTAH